MVLMCFLSFCNLFNVLFKKVVTFVKCLKGGSYVELVSYHCRMKIIIITTIVIFLRVTSGH